MHEYARATRLKARFLVASVKQHHHITQMQFQTLNGKFKKTVNDQNDR